MKSADPVPFHKSTRLCVASYGEDVDWVRGTGIEACIYDATGTRGKGFIPVRNKGREAGQYLRHINDHYDDLMDYEVFLQGNPFDHCRRILTHLSERRWEGSEFFPLGGAKGIFNPNSKFEYVDCLLPFAREIGVRNFQDWTVGAMFAVSRNSLRSRPREWWKALLDKTLFEPWSPWVLEQLWPAILNPAPVQPPPKP